MSDRVKVLLAAALAVGLGACASDPPAKVAEAPDKKECMRETGTRIKKPGQECINASGKVYSAEDLDRTGAQTVDEALRRLGR